MTQHYDQWSTESLCGELDAADLRWRNDISGDADHEQIAQTMIENDFYGYPRIRTTENDRKRFLTRHEFIALSVAHRYVKAASARYESGIPVAQAIQCFSRWYHHCSLSSAQRLIGCSGYHVTS